MGTLCFLYRRLIVNPLYRNNLRMFSMRMLRNALIDRVDKFKSLKQILYMIHYLMPMANGVLECKERN
jgi:hypothetical protein